MQIHLQFDRHTAAQLSRAAENQTEQVESVITRAVHEWLERNILAQWPKQVQCFKGMSDIPLFESGRDKLIPPCEDPLA